MTLAWRTRVFWIDLLSVHLTGWPFSRPHKVSIRRCSLMGASPLVLIADLITVWLGKVIMVQEITRALAKMRMSAEEIFKKCNAFLLKRNGFSILATIVDSLSLSHTLFSILHSSLSISQCLFRNIKWTKNEWNKDEIIFGEIVLNLQF